MEGQKWDLFNTLVMDDPTFNSDRIRSYQAFANVHTAAGGLDPVPEDDDPPPRATGVAQTVTDMPVFPEPLPPMSPSPTPKHDLSYLSGLVLGTSPALSTIPDTVVPPAYRDGEVMREGVKEIEVSNQQLSSCGEPNLAGDDDEWKKCVAGIYIQLAGSDSIHCDFNGGEKQGKSCAFKDILTGKLQGYAMGWQFGVKHLAAMYMRAYRFGYTQAYDLSFKEGRQKFIAEQAMGGKVAIVPKPTSSEDDEGEETPPVDITKNPTTDSAGNPANQSEETQSTDKEANAKRQEAANDKKAAENKEKQQNLKDNYAEEDKNRKQAACDKEKADKNADDHGGQRTVQQKNADNNKECDTGPGVTSQPKLRGHAVY